MTRTRLRTTTAALILLTAAALAGCSTTSGGSAAPPPTSSAPTEAPAASSTPTPTATSEPVAVTCDNTVTAEALTTLQSEGYTGEPFTEPWVIAGTPVKGGVSCKWMIDHSIGTDNFLWVSWAPLNQTETDTAIAALMADGNWIREDAAEGVYVTAAGAEMLPVTDQDGYASTYLFTGDQVKFAGTKAELSIITAPPGFGL